MLAARPIALLLALVVAGSANAQAPSFIRGGDLSSLYRLEQSGALFTRDRVPGPAMEILRDLGMNLVRLRLWHTPAGGVNGLQETLAMARQVEDAGLALLLDFHYSDTWADPGKQFTPAAWEDLTFEVLLDSVEAYTHDVIAALRAQGTLPEMVQLGNEVTGGMLWPAGQLYASNDPQERVEAWHRFGDLLKAAKAGLERALEPGDTVEIMLHIDRGGSLSDSQWFYDHILAEGVEFDVIGLSYYPWWHGSLTSLRSTLNGVAQRYDKDIVLAEVGYPFTTQFEDGTPNAIGTFTGSFFSQYPPSRVSQEAVLTEVRRLVEATPNGRGRGYIYWEPAWIAWPGSDGSPWENVALFNFGGELNPAAPVFYGMTGVAAEPEPVPGAMGIAHVAYPNPASSQATIDVTLGAPVGLRLELYDVLGRRVMVREAAAGPLHQRLSLGVDALVPGLYVYRLIAGSDRTATGRLIVL